MRVTTLIQKFNAGEMTPRLDGFVGFDKYASGCRILENMIPLAQGPVTRRPGTKFVAEVKDSANRVGFIPFEFSTVQAYVIEVGDQYFRFYRNNGPVLETALTITGATQANPVVVTYTGSDPSNGDHVEIASVGGMTQLNGRRFKVANVNAGANTLELQNLAGNNIDGTGYGVYTSGGALSRVYTLTTPYALADLFDDDGRLRLKFAQSADVMYIVHPDYAPRKLTRTADASWTITEVEFVDGPYLDENTSATTLTADATTGNVTITASADTFASTDVGRLIGIGYPATAWAASTAYSVGDIRYNQGNVYECVTAGTSAASGGPTGTGVGIVDGTAQWDWLNTGGLSWGYLRVTAYTSATSVDADVERTLGSTSARTTWRLGAWSETTGYPAAVGFHEERLFFGGALFNPQRLDASKSNDFETFTPGTRDDDPLAFSMASDQVNAIKWFASARDLIVGTIGAEGRIGSDSLNAPLTPTNVTVRWQTRHGCADMLPETISNAVLFVQRAGKKVREFAFTIEADSYKAPDLTQLADHIAGDGLVDLAYQQEPWSVIWAPRTDGVLCGLTYWRDEAVVAWHRHILGGAFGDGDAVVEAVSSIPVTGADQLWLCVKRTINGRTVRYVEYMEQPLSDTADQEDAFYVDCGLAYSGSAVSSLSGLWHLEGQTVKVWTNKGVHPDCVVENGAISLDYEITAASVGLGYTWRVKPMRLEAGAQAGTAQGQIKRVDTVWARLYRTLSVKAGRSETSGQYSEISFRDGQDDTDTAPPLFSGDKKVTFPGTYDTDGAVLLFGDDPTPVTLVCLVIRLATNEG